MIYLSFVEGEANKSGFKVSKGGRVFFYYHDLEALTKRLIKSKFKEIETFKVRYPTSAAEFEIHTILTAKKE